MKLVQGLKQALQELDKIVMKYKALARRKALIWNSFRCATKDLSPVRGKLGSYMNAINAFGENLSREFLVEIQTTLYDMIDEARRGQRRPTFIPNSRQENGLAWT